MIGRLTHGGLWIGGGVLLTAAFLLFDAGTASAIAPRWMAIYLLAIGALIWLTCRGRVRVDSIDMLALGYLVWAALSLLWSPDPKAGLLHWQNTACLFAIAYWVRHCEIFDDLLPVVLSGAICAAVGLGIAIPEVHGGFGNENFIAEFVLIGTALLIGLRYRHVWLEKIVTATVLAAVVYLAFFNDSHLQYLAAFAGIVFVGWLCWKHRFYAFLPVFGIVVLVLVAGLALHDGHMFGITKSLTDRAEIWINTAYMIGQSPVWGHGLGSFDYVYPRSEHIALLGNHTFLGEPTDFIGSAHNDYLHLIAELGLAGFALAGLLVWQIFRWGTGPGRFALYIVAVLALVGFPLQSPSSALCGALSAGLAARGRGWRLIPVPSGNLLGLLALPLAASAFFFYSGYTQAKDIHRLIGVSPAHALQVQLGALETYDWDPWLRLQTTLTLATVLRTYKPTQVELDPVAADKIYEISRSAAPEHPGVLITRIEYLLNSGRHSESDEIEHTLAVLKKRGPLYAETWALDALYAGRLRDEARMEHAVRKALGLPRGRKIFERMGLLRESL